MEGLLQQSHDDKLRIRLPRGGSMSPTRIKIIVALLLSAFCGIQIAVSGHGSPNGLRRYNDPFTRELEDVGGNCTLDCCQALEEEICGRDNSDTWIAAIPFAVQILMIIILLSMSALVSGLTLGMMSLDTTGLEIVISGDDPIAAAQAKAILPVRRDGNLLLCTLVLVNVLVNALLSILMAEYTGGVVGLFSSTILIVVFGEILPQAIVSNTCAFLRVALGFERLIMSMHFHIKVCKTRIDHWKQSCSSCQDHGRHRVSSGEASCLMFRLRSWCGTCHHLQ